MFFFFGGCSPPPTWELEVIILVLRCPLPIARNLLIIPKPWGGGCMCLGCRGFFLLRHLPLSVCLPDLWVSGSCWLPSLAKRPGLPPLHDGRQALPHPGPCTRNTRKRRDVHDRHGNPHQCPCNIHWPVTLPRPGDGSPQAEAGIVQKRGHFTGARQRERKATVSSHELKSGCRPRSKIETSYPTSPPPPLCPPPPPPGNRHRLVPKKTQQCHIAQDCIIMRARC